jgi:hypothetical protein
MFKANFALGYGLEQKQVAKSRARFHTAGKAASPDPARLLSDREGDLSPGNAPEMHRDVY